MNNLNMILPTDIISDILTRLPTESVLESKVVCKTWENLIQHPSFPKSHLARLNHPDSADSGKLRYVFLISDHVYCSEYNVNEDWNYVKPIHRKIVSETKSNEYIAIGSFNGLVCMYGKEPLDILKAYRPALIINPVTKEYVVIPEFFTKRSDYVHLACEFGYLVETDEYKVVRITYYLAEPNVVEVDVYTVGSGKGWRHVGKFDLGFVFDPYSEHTHGLFLNGSLLWRNIKGGMVLVFDLADEKFRDHIPPPVMLMGTLDDENSFIGVFGDGILYYAICQYGEGNGSRSCNLWLLMKKNDDQNGQVNHQSWGWSEVTSLDQREPFSFTLDGAVLRFDEGNIKIFHSTTSTWENYTSFMRVCRLVIPHKHTLLSPKELGEKDVQIMKSRGIDETYSRASD